MDSVQPRGEFQWRSKVSRLRSGNRRFWSEGRTMPDDFPSADESISLQFSYDGLNISLDDAQVVEAAWAESEDTGPLSGEPGFWYELRDAADTVLWRQSAVHPIWFESEGPADDVSAMTWGDDPAPAGAVVAPVPPMPPAASPPPVGSPPPRNPPPPPPELAGVRRGRTPAGTAPAGAKRGAP